MNLNVTFKCLIIKRYVLKDDLMYRVLIVEDEKLVRIGLKHSVDWAGFGMTVMADVPDGLAALEVYEREKPHLIITDLKMPVMGGMELISRIREKDRDTRFLILTCLEEFDLARKAMNLDVSGYIIKLTMTDNEIASVLSKVQKELDSLQNSDMEKPLLENGINLIRDKIFTDFMFCDTYTEEEFSRHVQKLKLNLTPDRLLMCVLEIDHFQKLKDLFDDQHGQLIKFSLLNVINEILENNNAGEVIYYNETKYFIIFSLKAAIHESRLYDEIHYLLNKIGRSMEKYFNVKISFGISRVDTGYASLKSMFNEASKALENKFFIGTGIFRVQDKLNKAEILRDKASVLSGLSEELYCVNETFKKQYEIKIKYIIENMPETKEDIIEMFCSTLQWIAAALRIADSNSLGVVVNSNKAIQNCETFDEIISCVREFVVGIKNITQQNKILSDEISLAVQYMEANYNTDISLNHVAEHINLSSGYLSILFKKELQVNFIDYLNDLRIEKAKELLLGTYLKSYEIAEKIGFNDNTYFSKAFKRHTGISPSEFRKKWVNGWEE